MAIFVDGPWLVAGAALYFAAAVTAIMTRAHPAQRATLTLLVIAIAIHSVSILVRWERLDHGPYVNLFEVLSSNVWSLHVAVLIACIWFRSIRPSLATTLPVLQVLVLWLVLEAPIDTTAPVTYATIWLAVHVWLGKIFLGCMVIAVGLALTVLLRKMVSADAFARLPTNARLDEMSYRFVLVAFIFQCLMLVAGAIWAQDAWGRYWAWDPLETSAFVTWLAVIAYLHVRVVRRPSPVVGAVLVIGIFAIAFTTLFGVPFVSTAPHKGAI